MSSSAISSAEILATSPSNSTPASSASQRPSLYMKPLPTATSLSPGAASPPTSLTSKEWVIPPRPKPGRKPATDTPPTKRKAQNRAAQRAFRERRAARVGELEEQIKQIEDEHEQQQDDLRLSVTKLEEEIERYRNDLATWIEKCRRLEKELAAVNAAPSTVKSVVVADNEPVGCGNCTLETRCQCIDDAFNAMNDAAPDMGTSQAEKRPASPIVHQDQRRVKTEPSDDMEIDFTAMYSKPNGTTVRNEGVSPTSAVADPCGFCQDGTPCICAEMAAEQERSTTVRVGSPSSSYHPGPRQLAQFTPPPSEGDVTHSIPPQPAGCASGPGTCNQCQKDPNSTLFCKSLAASRSQSATVNDGCCGGKSADGGCCQSQDSTSRSTKSRASASSRRLPPLQASKSSITLTCADAYTTLSRHPAYERASGEIATWMPKLYANPASDETRPAMEIDAANVMAVLRDFDRRFGAER